eukprot:763240-Hanusia_phi.AAC.2
MAADSYQEGWRPIFLPLTWWLPPTWRFEISVAPLEQGESDSNDTRYALSFGYCLSMGMMRKSVMISNVKEGSMQRGFSDWKQNLMQFGGWGIRYRHGMWNYNASNGDWFEFEEVGTGRRYRFACKHADDFENFIRKKFPNLLNR